MSVMLERFKRDPYYVRLIEETWAEGNFAYALAQLRVQRGLTQRDVARRAGMKQSMLARLERAGQTPTITTVFRLMRALDARCEIGPEGITIHE